LAASGAFGGCMAYIWAKIERILVRIADAVEKNKYRLAINENREKNQAFLDLYGINGYMIKKILTELDVKDFSETVQNHKPGYEDEELYIFGPKVMLRVIGEESEREVVVYIKVNIIELKIDDFLVVVSFHEAEKEMEYAFDGKDFLS
jgi:hypothetical protein